MRTILYLIRKEFLQIFRNKFISKAIFGVPIVQMLILVPAITFEIKHVDLCIIDNDLSPESRGLVNKLEGSTFFSVYASAWSEDQANDLLHRNKCDMILNIPDGFGRELGRGDPSRLMATINAINASTAQLTWGYLSAIISDYNRDILLERTAANLTSQASLIQTTNRYWYNEMLNYKHYMLPGILVILVTAIGFLLAGLNMVREKEIGTIEQINVTPIRKHHFIIGKLLPFWILGLVVFTIGLIFAKLIFKVPVVGSLWLLYAFTGLYLLAILGIGLFISTITDTQQQAMFISWFFLVIFILMSGLFTAIENMPVWAQKITLLNPLRYFMEVVRMVLLKGSVFRDVKIHFLIIGAFSVLINAFAVWRYRKIA